MKKSISILLTLFTVVLLFSLTAVVSSAATTATNSDMIVHEIDGGRLPLAKLNGLPENAYLSLANVEGDYTVFLGQNVAGYEWFGVVAYSENGIDFKCVYDTDIIAQTELANYTSAAVFCDESITYIDGYYYIPAVYYLDEDYENEVICEVRTSNFEEWELYSSSSDVVLPNEDSNYIGEYNGIHIAQYYGVTYDKGIVYYVSNDGVNWTRKTTPKITSSEIDSTDLAYETVAEINITSAGVIFSVHQYQFVDAVCTITTKFSDYYITKDFSNYTKIDMSVLGECKGNLKDGTAYYDTLDMVVAFADANPVFYRMHGDMIYNEEFWATAVTSNKTEIYTLNEDGDKLVLDSSFTNCSSGRFAFLTKTHYFWWSSNVDYSSTLYIKEGGKFTKSDCESIDAEYLDYFYHITYDNYSNGIKPDGIADLEHIMGLESFENIIITKDMFKNVFKVTLPIDNVEYLSWSKDGQGMYIYTSTWEDDYGYNECYYYVDLNQALDYIETQIPTPTGNYTGLFKYNGTWLYAKNGEVDFSYTGLVKHTNGIWYYVEDGILDWSYSGLWKHNGTWYYVQKGQINWKFTGLVQHTNGTWYYVQGAKLNWGYTGLVKHNTGSWFYVQKGQINFDYTGLVKHTNGIWYYIENGKLDWGHSGLWKHNGTWYYVQKGQINWKFTGLVKHTNGIWYYVQGAKLNWNYTGLVQHTNGKWYYVQKGQINFNYTGYVTHNGTKYKVVNGVKV